MGLEFKIQEIDSENSIEVTADGDPGNAWIGLVYYNQEERVDFDTLDIEEILSLALFLNHKLKFDLFDINNIQRKIKEEKIYNESNESI